MSSSLSKKFYFKLDASMVQENSRVNIHLTSLFGNFLLCVSSKTEDIRSDKQCTKSSSLGTILLSAGEEGFKPNQVYGLLVTQTNSTGTNEPVKAGSFGILISSHLSKQKLIPGTWKKLEGAANKTEFEFDFSREYTNNLLFMVDSSDSFTRVTAQICSLEDKTNKELDCKSLNEETMSALVAVRVSRVRLARICAETSKIVDK